MLVGRVGCWRILSRFNNSQAGQWLQKSGLDSQRFRTRKDALSVLILALQMPEAIKPSASPVCRRISDGHYQLAGQLKAKRDLNYAEWTIYSLEIQSSWQARSLWSAASIAQALFEEQQSLNDNHSEDNPSALLYRSGDACSVHGIGWIQCPDPLQRLSQPSS